ncbi:translocation/assembly module TamB domain-containing protein, partial [Escherichia coli]|nr:translocation/assembly module TamB domain-containing protein [Escherichia coli]
PGDAPLEDAAPLPRQPGPLARALDLDLVLNLGQRFQLRGRGIDSRLTGELRLTSPQGRLAAHGEIRTVEGKYEAYGQELEI